IAFAEAMNVNDGTITSSTGPTPMAARARWRPVVHGVVAMPCFAPTYVATAFPNSATFGPCVTQPLLIDSNGARASSSVSAGLVIGMLSFFFASTAIGLSLSLHGRFGRAGVRERAPAPVDETAHAIAQGRLGPEPEDLFGSLRVPDATGRERSGWLRAVFDSDVAPGDLEEKVGEIAHAGLHASADVHDRVRSARLGGQHVRAHDVVDVHEVRGGRSVTEEHDWLALVDEIEPPDHHLEVLRADVLPRAVDIEVAQGGGR